ncbi:hypothetical protein EIB18_04695 [Caulobacter vibrioides]|uniref:hypothetical protein n=1 Tax=Caulobacter vibrioides TaxID=155892 RepID=UPI000BB50546|nr:hypothetical protein [Caulobacter vibrioides]ATC23842.1 hypothetical protein CA608_04485 [Caulobacter vibrioides]AZH12077.1 hypothetical protein EIB18_04695 [Caulobacter vibrioides]PLR15949.1 hypothetical protein CVUC_02320 [Caulobacter vibrioides]
MTGKAVVDDASVSDACVAPLAGAPGPPVAAPKEQDGGSTETSVSDIDQGSTRPETSKAGRASARLTSGQVQKRT